MVQFFHIVEICASGHFAGLEFRIVSDSVCRPLA
jgi:hypothetical protein